MMATINRLTPWRRRVLRPVLVDKWLVVAAAGLDLRSIPTGGDTYANSAFVRLHGTRHILTVVCWQRG